MWRRTYLVLLLIRVYFALSPSYLHPDENFQGPEVFAGQYPRSIARSIVTGLHWPSLAIPGYCWPAG